MMARKKTNQDWTDDAWRLANAVADEHPAGSDMDKLANAIVILAKVLKAVSEHVDDPFKEVQQ